MDSTSTRKPRVLMFAPACIPATQPEAIVNANLAKAFVEAGWGIDIISLQNYGTWYPKSDDLWAEVVPFVHFVPDEPKGKRNELVSILKFAAYSRLAVRQRGWTIQAFETAKKLASRNRYDLILSRSLPGSAHLPALLLSRRTGIPWIANWNDPYPPQKHPPPYGDGPESPLYRGDMKTLPAIAKAANWHTFPCERLRALMCSYMEGDVQARSSVIPHIAVNPASPSQRSSDTFTICHAGSLRPPRDARAFLEGVKRFASGLESPKICVRFIVEQPDHVNQVAAEVGIRNLVVIEQPKPYEQMHAALDDCDVLAIIEAPMKEGVFLPSKFVDYAQTGRPILAVSPTVGTLVDLLTEHGGGIAVDGQSSAAIADGIQLLFDSWKAGTLQESHGSQRLVKLFRKEHVIGLYEDLLSRFGRGQR